MTSKFWGGHGPLGPPGSYAYASSVLNVLCGFMKRALIVLTLKIIVT